MADSNLPFTFAVNAFTTWPWSFEEDLRQYKQLGIDTIEICEAKLDAERMEEQLQLVKNYDLTISSVQPAVRTIFPAESQPEPAAMQGRMEALHHAIERIAPYAPDAAFVTNTGPAPGGNMQAAVSGTIEAYQKLAVTAEKYGVRLALEPLHPTLLNAETAIWTYQQGLNIVREIDRDNVGLCLDLWNLWQDPHLIESASMAPESIFLLHVSDWRMPLSQADRRSIGTGEIPIGKLLRAVHRIGYGGACVLEILSSDVPDSLYDGDLAALIAANRDSLQHAWENE